MPRAASRTRSPAPARSGIRRLLPLWWAVAIPALVGMSALVPASPVRDAATGGAVPEAVLERPAAYVALAPVSNLLDALSLFSLRQHFAFIATVALLLAVWWWRRGRNRPVTGSATRRAGRHAVRALLALAGLVALYAVGVLLPRPMARLAVDADVLAIDFHAHTLHSHDGRWNWTAEDVRRWHASGGYDVAFITDHRTFAGAREGWANNPAFAGQGTVLLPGIEVVWKGEHVNVLNADRVYSGLFTSTLRDIDEDALRLASSIGGKEPVVIETLPGDLSRMIPARGRGTAGVRALEIVDGAPKGLGQTRRERARIIRLADSLDLALVSGSNSHGWGHAAQGWTLMVLPRWRAATPEQLAEAIDATIRSSGRGATRVVERWIPHTDEGIALPFTVPVVLWGMLRTLSGPERVMWIVWTLAAVGLWWLRQRRRAGPVAS